MWFEIIWFSKHSQKGVGYFRYVILELICLYWTACAVNFYMKRNEFKAVKRQRDCMCIVRTCGGCVKSWTTSCQLHFRFAWNENLVLFLKCLGKDARIQVCDFVCKSLCVTKKWKSLLRRKKWKLGFNSIKQADNINTYLRNKKPKTKELFNTKLNVFDKKFKTESFRSSKSQARRVSNV